MSLEKYIKIGTDLDKEQEIRVTDKQHLLFWGAEILMIFYFSTLRIFYVHIS